MLCVFYHSKKISKHADWNSHHIITKTTIKKGTHKTEYPGDKILKYKD